MGLYLAHLHITYIHVYPIAQLCHFYSNTTKCMFFCSQLTGSGYSWQMETCWSDFLLSLTLLFDYLHLELSHYGTIFQILSDSWTVLGSASISW